MKVCQTACLWFLLLFFTINVAAIEGESLVTHLNEDNEPPRVVDVVYFWDEDDLTNITFYVQIEENGSGVAEVILYYYFRPMSEAPEANETTKRDHGMTYFENATMTNFNNTYWGVDVPFNPKTSVEILFKISVVDNAGNWNPNAFPLGLDPTMRKNYVSGKTVTRGFPGFTVTLLLVSGIAILLFRKHSRRRLRSQ